MTKKWYKEREIVSFTHQNKTKRERQKMRPTTKTKRESTRQATRHTQSRSSLKQKVNYYLSNPMGGSNPRRAKETMLFTTKGNKNDHIIPLSTQRKKGRSCPTTNTKRERERVRPPSNDTHTKPFIATTKWGAEPSRVAQTPQPKAQSHASLKQKDNHHVPREKRMIISFDY